MYPELIESEENQREIIVEKADKIERGKLHKKLRDME